MDRKAMYKLSYGLFILTAKEAEKDNGCIINTASHSGGFGTKPVKYLRQ